jgi:hypothetical protein
LCESGAREAQQHVAIKLTRQPPTTTPVPTSSPAMAPVFLRVQLQSLALGSVAAAATCLAQAQEWLKLVRDSPVPKGKSGLPV